MVDLDPKYQDLQGFVSRRRQLFLFLKLDEILEFEQQSIKKHQRPKTFLNCCTCKSDKRLSVSSTFRSAFNTLTQAQKIDYYCKTVEYLEQYCSSPGGQPIEIPVVPIASQSLQVYDACVRTGGIGQTWTDCRMEVNPQQLVIKIIKTNQSTMSIDLRNYLLRNSSNKDRYAFALEATLQSIEKVIRIGFYEEAPYRQCHKFIQQLIHKGLKANLQTILLTHRQSEILKPGEIKKSQLIIRQKNPQSVTLLPIQPRYSYVQSSSKIVVPKIQQSTKPVYYNMTNQKGKFTGCSNINNKKPAVDINRTINKKYSTHTGHDTSKTALKTGHSESKIQDEEGVQLVRRQTLVGSIDKTPLNKVLNKTIVGELLQESNDIPPEQIEIENQMLENIRDTDLGKAKDIILLEQEVERIHGKKNLDLFHHILPDFDPEDLYETADFKQIRSGHGFSILQGISYSRVYKLVTSNIKAPVRTVLGLVSDPANYKRWNPQVQLGNIKILIQTENSCVAYQKHKGYSNRFYPRDFLYVRHVFRKDQVVYMVDKSIKYIYSPPFNSVVRGDIYYCLWGLEQVTKTETKLNLQIQIRHRGNIGLNKQHQLTIRYLQGISNISTYVNTSNTDLKPDTFFTLDWDIDKKSSAAQGQVKPEENKHDESSLFSHDLCQQIEEDEMEEEFISINDEDWAEADVNAQEQSNHRGRVESLNSFAPPNQPLPENIDFGQCSIVKRCRETPNTQNHEVQQKRPRNISNESDKMLVNNIFNTMEGKRDSATFRKKLRNQQLAAPLSEVSQRSQISEVDKVSMDQIQQPKITKPRISQIAAESTCEVDKQGYVILPSIYLNKRHQLEPVAGISRMMNGRGWEHYLWRDLWVRAESGQLKCINQQKLKEQSKVLSYVLKNAAKGLMVGKGILNISFPVEVISELSGLELLGRGFCLCPQFLEKAGELEHPAERMKLTISFALSFSLLYLEMEKPFNPILGETFQGWIAGCPFYAQQISHHPPISSFYFIGKGFRVAGSVEAKVHMSANSGIGSNQGEITVSFDRFPGQIIKYQGPGGEMVGLIYGERKFAFTGQSHFYDSSNNIYADLTFNPGKKSYLSWGKQVKPSDTMQGKIVQTTASFFSNYLGPASKRNPPKPEEITDVVSEIGGRWTEALVFDGKVYFNVQQEKPFALQQQKYPLSSNCNYREDVYYRRMLDFSRAQIEKERLENIQRKDLKLRERMAGGRGRRRLC